MKPETKCSPSVSYKSELDLSDSIVELDSRCPMLSVSVSTQGLHVKAVIVIVFWHSNRGILSENYMKLYKVQHLENSRRESDTSHPKSNISSMVETDLADFGKRIDWLFVYAGLKATMLTSTLLAISFFAWLGGWGG